MTKVPDHVGFVSQQSTDKIGDLSIHIRRFCICRQSSAIVHRQVAGVDA